MPVEHLSSSSMKESQENNMAKSIKKEALAQESTSSILAEIDQTLSLFEKNDVDAERIFDAMGKIISKKVSQKLL